jgi:hypothetical protein
VNLTLVQLEAHLLRRDPKDGREQHVQVDALAQAQGVWFLCPKCFTANGGAAGTHMVLCWFRDRGVPAEVTPGPARWVVTGTGLDDLTLSPSIQLLGACKWHGFIVAGAVQ